MTVLNLWRMASSDLTWLSGYVPGLLDNVRLGLGRALTNSFETLIVIVVCVSVGMNLCRLLE